MNAFMHFMMAQVPLFERTCRKGIPSAGWTGYTPSGANQSRMSRERGMENASDCPDGSGLAAGAALPAQEPVVGVKDPESLFKDPVPALNKNKQAALHIMRELLQCGQWDRPASG